MASKEVEARFPDRRQYYEVITWKVCHTCCATIAAARIRATAADELAATSASIELAARRAGHAGCDRHYDYGTVRKCSEAEQDPDVGRAILVPCDSLVALA